METGVNQQKWLEALRSGKYEQGQSFLNAQDKLCCLGIGCELFATRDYDNPGGIMSYDGCITTAPKSVIDALALRGILGDTDGSEGYHGLSAMNDGLGLTFSEIADVVESNPSVYFIESR